MRAIDVRRRPGLLIVWHCGGNPHTAIVAPLINFYRSSLLERHVVALQRLADVNSSAANITALKMAVLHRALFFLAEIVGSAAFCLMPVVIVRMNNMSHLPVSTPVIDFYI